MLISLLGIHPACSDDSFTKVTPGPDIVTKFLLRILLYVRMDPSDQSRDLFKLL